MSTPVMLITGDWHVRKHDRVWYRRPSLTGDTSFGVEQVNQLAEKYSVPHVVLLGDLFEQKLQQSDALGIMWGSLTRFERNRQAVYYVQGQHEKSDPPILNAIHDWPLHIHGDHVHIPELGRYLHGLDYQPPAHVAEALADTPTPDILATHQVWKDFMGEDRGDAWFHGASTDLILTGDFHQTLIEDRGSRTVVSPGPLCMQNIGEEPDKFVIIMTDDEDDPFIKERLKSRRYHQTYLHTDDDLTRFLDTWPDNPARTPQPGVPFNIATNILRVRYAADIPDVTRRVESVVGDAAHLFLNPFPVERQEAQSVEADRRVNAVLSGGLDGCIREFYAEDPEVLADALRLNQSNDIEQELEAIYKERMARGEEVQAAQ